MVPERWRRQREFSGRRRALSVSVSATAPQGDRRYFSGVLERGRFGGRFGGRAVQAQRHVAQAAKPARYVFLLRRVWTKSTGWRVSPKAPCRCAALIDGTDNPSVDIQRLIASIPFSTASDAAFVILNALTLGILSDAILDRIRKVMDDVSRALTIVAEQAKGIYAFAPLKRGDVVEKTGTPRQRIVASRARPQINGPKGSHSPTRECG